MISILDQQIEELQKKKREIDDKKWEVTEAFHKNLTSGFTDFFKNTLPVGITLKVHGENITFHKKENPEDKYEKELFTLYLSHDYFTETKDTNKYYNSVRGLNYYTCGTTKSEFELTRLTALGKVAEVLLKSESEILELANRIACEYQEAITQGDYYKRSWDIEKVIKELKQSKANIEKESRKKLLLGTGITFDKAVEIQLKFNFSPRIKFIKVKDLGRSGKKVKVEFSYGLGNTEHMFEEENVSMENLLSQIEYYRSSIVQPETVE